MLLTRKSVKTLELPAGMTDKIFWDENMRGLRLAASRWQPADMGLPIQVRYEEPTQDAWRALSIRGR